MSAVKIFYGTNPQRFSFGGPRLLSDGFKNGMVQQKPEVTFDRGGVKEFEDKTLLCMFLSNLTEDAAQNV